MHRQVVSPTPAFFTYGRDGAEAAKGSRIFDDLALEIVAPAPDPGERVDEDQVAQLQAVVEETRDLHPRRLCPRRVRPPRTGPGARRTYPPAHTGPSGPPGPVRVSGARERTPGTR